MSDLSIMLKGGCQKSIPFDLITLTGMNVAMRTHTQKNTGAL
ncbi:hypothetical protein N474_04715 [Pseudoalteromonas luteoviolacea CPMOR-2]|uniref:Uncharacterized protein n=1 Tax=Pseudoalteromonas luteoviolacea DSM 6061 TaxID=1365250 RepID=A0A166WJ01_9GAMM|nr:hypothetical protein [Pseudoalteromonas luteoviolacea]KZN37538.1 hypothetical protein N475_01625 [Pseudoalteromonas luteoviolacea DSM 6061]KZN49564.1 hypothetical protein N474_04715 [Pseudoalteromonas luteoviolacea CPMOR-2]